VSLSPIFRAFWGRAGGPPYHRVLSRTTWSGTNSGTNRTIHTRPCLNAGMALLSEDHIRYARVFHPRMLERLEALVTAKGRFVHYTSAEAAMSIIAGERVWMRRTSCMNDFSEVQHGIGCLARAYRTESGDRFRAALEARFAGLTQEIEALFDRWIYRLEQDTYVTSLSEHDTREDDFGRLSMWRAYGGTTGVALVMNTTAFQSSSDALGAHTSPVEYLTEQEVAVELVRVADGLSADEAQVEQLGREGLKHAIFNVFRYAAICNKHPGFSEEREWRIICTPGIDSAQRLEREMRCVAGVPQPILKIPLKDYPEEGLTGASIPSLLNRIIIGPTQYPIPIADAFADLLAKAGVRNPGAKITISRLPLRT
jgi:hypothetical protein